MDNTKKNSKKHNIGETLKDLRLTNEKTQQDIADLLGIKQQTYSTYESGTYEPNIEMLTKLSDFYKVPIDIILKGITTTRPKINYIENSVWFALEQINDVIQNESKFDTVTVKICKLILSNIYESYTIIEDYTERHINPINNN